MVGAAAVWRAVCRLASFRLLLQHPAGSDTGTRHVSAAHLRTGRRYLAGAQAAEEELAQHPDADHGQPPPATLPPYLAGGNSVPADGLALRSHCLAGSPAVLAGPELHLRIVCARLFPAVVVGGPQAAGGNAAAASLGRLGDYCAGLARAAAGCGQCG